MIKCPKCGNVLQQDEKFCTCCGANLANVPTSQNYTHYTFSEDHMTQGQWIGTVALTTLLGIISIVLLFIWGFSSNAPDCKKKYCRAMLVCYGIVIGLWVLYFIVLVMLIAFGVLPAHPTGTAV